MEDPADFSVVNKINKLLGNQKKLKAIQEINRIKSKQFSTEKNLELTLDIIEEVMD